MRTNTHAIQRFRQRWPDWAYLPDKEIAKRLNSAVEKSMKSESVVYGPHASYHFFSLGGKDGYVVVNKDNDTIITIMPEDWCPQVSGARKQCA